MDGHLIGGSDLIVAAVEDAEEVAEPTQKPRLLVEPASPENTIPALRDILVDAGGLYDRGTPVRLHDDAMRGGKRVQVLGPNDAILATHQVCRPYSKKPDKSGAIRDVDVRLPRSFADMYLGWYGEWRLPALNGITSSPLLREDGSLHAIDGYDAQSGMWCERVPDIKSLIPSRPSRSEAEAALRVLRQTFGTFCFADAVTRDDPQTGVKVVDLDTPPGMDESSFLVAMLTAVCRASLSLAPGVLVRAAALSGAGAGKGLLVRCICLIAFGQDPRAVSGGSGREELEKRIAAELIEANPVLFLDNLNNRTFKSDLLASAITERPACIRILGRSEMATLNSSAFVVLTGNGLELSEDLVRRFMVIEFDPRTEDPEARPFVGDIKQVCREKRDELLAAALLIWRWGRQSGGEVRGLPLGSFEQWAAWVRDPLLALGCQDPVARVSDTKSRDIERQQTTEAFDRWWAVHGDTPVALKDISPEVLDLLGPPKSTRQYMAKRLASLSGTRIGGRILTRQASTSKWGVDRYALTASNTPDTKPDCGTPNVTRRSTPPYAPYDPYAFGDQEKNRDGLMCNKSGDRPGPDAAIEPEGARKNLGGPETHRGHRGHRACRSPDGSTAEAASEGHSFVHQSEGADRDITGDTAASTTEGTPSDANTMAPPRWRARI